MKLQIIIGATRPGRNTDRYAKWIASEAANLDGIEVEMIDLIDYELPFFDEAISPRYNPDRKPTPAVQKWLDKISEGEAYIFVTPEYNHAPSAVLKNAIDFLTYELKNKPAAVASHGSVGGARAIVAMKEVLSEAQAAIIPAHVALVGFIAMGTILDENGVLIDEAIKANPYGPTAAVKGMLAEVKWYGDALKAARA